MEGRERRGGVNDFLCYSSNGLAICRVLRCSTLNRTGLNGENNCTLDLFKKYIAMFSLHPDRPAQGGTDLLVQERPFKQWLKATQSNKGRPINGERSLCRGLAMWRNILRRYSTALKYSTVPYNHKPTPHHAQPPGTRNTKKHQIPHLKKVSHPSPRTT